MQLETPLSASEGASQAEDKSRQFDETSAEDGLQLIQSVLRLWRNKQTISRFTVATAGIVFFVLKPTCTQMPFFTPQSPPVSTMNQLAGPPAFGAIGALGGLKNPGMCLLAFSVAAR